MRPATALAVVGALALGVAAYSRAAPPLPRAHLALPADPLAPIEPAAPLPAPATIAPAAQPALANPAPAATPAPDPMAPAAARPRGRRGCPADMVRVAGRFCIDRFEATMVDVASGRPLSPYYPPTPKLFRQIVEQWADAPTPPVASLLPMPFPEVPSWQREAAFAPRAVSSRSVVPQGYVSGVTARAACEQSGKRLCSLDEWTTACRGARGTQYPYGDTFSAASCNVFREEHPAHLLHGSFSTGLLDPRLNQVAYQGEPLLRATGASPACKSAWGDDAVYDMVGNLDEWVDDPDGTFVGGFYARATRSGCDAKVSAHPATYFDYSTGVRCCDAVR